MTISFGLSIFVMLGGLALWFLTTGRASEVGRICFAVGLLVSLLRFAGEAALHIGAR